MFVKNAIIEEIEHSFQIANSDRQPVSSHKRVIEETPGEKMSNPSEEEIKKWRKASPCHGENGSILKSGRHQVKYCVHCHCCPVCIAPAWCTKKASHVRQCKPIRSVAKKQSTASNEAEQKRKRSSHSSHASASGSSKKKKSQSNTKTNEDCDKKKKAKTKLTPDTLKTSGSVLSKEKKNKSSIVVT
jgi:hypothetical protein